MAKIILDDEFQTSLLKGASALCAVAVPNFGPTGRTTIAEQKYDLPLVANSGRKILKDFELEDPSENIGAVLLRDAALQVGLEHGDGTLATVVLTDSMLKDGQTCIASGANPIMLRKGMGKAAQAAEKAIMAGSFPADSSKLRELAVNIAKFEDVGETVFKAVDAVGADGTVTVEDSQGSETILNIWDGAKYGYGLINNAFIRDTVNQNTVIDDPYILLVNYKLKSMTEIMTMLEQSIQHSAKLLIIASDMEQTLQTQLIANVNKGILDVTVANAPAHGDTRRRNMLALAAKTGAMLFEENNGYDLSECGLEMCGRVGKAILTKDSTVLQGFPLEIPESVEILKRHCEEQLENTSDLDEREKLETTLTILNGRIAEIIAGGTTEYEMFERKYLAENAVRALKSAIKEGVLPGGGAAYLAAVPALETLKANSEDEQQGIEIVKKALYAPLKTLASNAGYSPESLMAKMEGSDTLLCYDTVTGEICDPVSRNILDPASVVRACLATAVSVAGTLLSSTAAVIRDKKD